MANLDKYPGEVGHKFTKLNTHVKLLLVALRDKKEETHDLILNLFRGYAASENQDFHEYIKNKRESYEDGYKLTARKLMTLSRNKYKLMAEAG